MTISDDEIKERAYRIWELWGRPDGLGDVIWDQAKRELEFMAEVERRRLMHAFDQSNPASGIPRKGPEP